MIYFVGAGPGAPDLITVRGLELLRRAHTVVYAGSLVNPALLEETPPECQLFNSAAMTLEQVLDKLCQAEGRAGRWCDYIAAILPCTGGYPGTNGRLA